MKKIIALIMAMSMTLALVACGGSAASSAASAADAGSKEESAASTAETASTAESASTADAASTAEAESQADAQSADAAAEFTTVTPGKLTMSTNAAFPPYEMTTDDGSYEGIDVEIAGAIAEKLGLELQIDDMDFSAALLAAQQGKSDMVMAGVTVNEERLNVMNFTDSYSTGVQVIIVPEGSDIESVDDLEGHKIGTQNATTGNIYCTDDYGDENVVGYDNGLTATQALLNGQIDCIVIDSAPAQEFVKANPGLKILDTEYVTEDYAIGISKENEPLLNAINAALAELIADGTVKGIVDKYISADEGAADEAAAEESTAEAAPIEFTTVTPGKLTMSTNAAFPPYEMTTDDGSYEGIDVEIAGAIAEKLGLELQIDDMDFSAALLAAQQGKSDMVMAGVTVNEERLNVMNFTDSYSTGVQVIIVPEGSDIESVDDLEGHIIGTQNATTGNIYCSDDYGEDNVVGYDNGLTATQALLNGQIDCIVIDSAPAAEFVKANPSLKILDTEYVTEDYAIGISKENEPLLEAINGALAELIADGTVKSIVDKYISAE